MHRRRRLPPPRLAPAKQPRNDPTTVIATAVALALRLCDESEEADHALRAATARRETALIDFERARQELEDAHEAEIEAMKIAGDAAAAYLSARFEAQQLGGSMPGELPRTAGLLVAIDLDEESSHG